ncbi:BQ2448_5662 [Microbotryum intermedium]|uniref:Chromosome segregation in meiosis protein n=1 Tax=Microbotryum intermedium TaxID=269621 RepID=A0A238F7E5_9BASI|nr:BQ2448_5662 [Microbotryum intermedium]
MDSDDSDVSNVRRNRRHPTKPPTRLFHPSPDIEDGQQDDDDDDVRSVVASKRARTERQALTTTTTTTTKATGNRTTKRALPRFLGDEDDEDEGPRGHGRVGETFSMLDDLFGDLERVPAFNKATDRDKANTRDKDRERARGGAEVEIVLPPRVEEDPWGDSHTNGIDPVGGLASTLDVDGISGKKQRQPMAKLNDVRLLGPSGFPKLLLQIQKFKVKAVKGEEMKDLKRVLHMYQLWCHQMYPRTNLRDTLKVVEKLCHKRSVQSALKHYREEYKFATQPAPPPDALGAEQEDQDGQAFDQSHGLVSSPTGPIALTRLNADTVLAEMNGTDGAMDEEEDEDWDEEAFEAMFANEENVLDELGRNASTTTSATTKQGGTTAASRMPDSRPRQEEEDVPDDLDEEDWMDDEAEAAMRELEG